MMVMIPETMPEPPAPAIALETISIFELTETAQSRLPSSKMAKKAKNDHYLH
jgi:hypothetical protein